MEAQKIVDSLSRRMSPDKMWVWLADPTKSHGVPDPSSVEKFGVVLDRTPIYAVEKGKTQLVIDEAKRFVRK